MQWAIALSPVALVILHLAVARRRLIIEETQTKTTLHILDDNIAEYLTKPSVGNRDLLFPEIVSYNNHFLEIIEGFKERKFRFVRIAHVIYDNGGPNFMKLRIDAPMLRRVNGWTMNDMGELYHFLKYTHKLWLDFKSIYEEVKTAVKGNWTQLKTTFQGTESPNTRWNITAMFENIVDPKISDNITTVPVNITM